MSLITGDGYSVISRCLLDQLMDDFAHLYWRLVIYQVHLHHLKNVKALRLVFDDRRIMMKIKYWSQNLLMKMNIKQKYT
jgi:hypothetical protein